MPRHGTALATVGVLITALLAGLTATVADERPPWPIESKAIEACGVSLNEVVVPPCSTSDGQPLIDLGLPAGTMITLVEHREEFVVPTGSTVVRAGDRLLVLGDDDGIRHLRERIDGVDNR